jgi:hypothetical protein
MRDKFKCIKCDLRLEGREDEVTGEVKPYDRAPSDPNQTPRPVVCNDCRDKP